MLNFYTTVARLCFFREPLPSGKSTRPIEEFTNSNEARYKVFASKEHADFLFDTINIFYAVKQNGGIESFFAQLTEHLRLFGCSNLFKEACEETPSARCQVLLLFLVEYMRRYKITTCSEQLCDFIRIVRNLLSTIRQVDELRYTSDVRINVLHRYWKEWSPSLDAYPPYAQLARPNGLPIFPDESEKAKLIFGHPELKCTIHKLEEHPLLRGLIHIFEPEKHFDKLTQWTEDFYSIWALVDTSDEALITQALIACDYEGSYIQDVWYGQKEAWFFGRGERWHTLLTNEGGDVVSWKEWKESLREPLHTLLDRYAAAKGTEAHEKLQGIVESYVATQAKARGWGYYFCKYPSMLAEQPYYAWADDGFAIRRMGSYSRHPLSAYHCNPYAYAVSQFVGGDAQLGWGRHSDCPPDLTVANTLTLTCQKDGWLVKWCDGVSLSPAIERVLGQYGVDKPDGVLRDTPDQDRIQRAVAFCRSLLALQ